MRKLSVFFLCLGVCSCGGESELAIPKNVRYETLKVDAVHSRKDPKGGWLGPSLRDIYISGRGDTPEVFCGSGPSVPTGEQITVFWMYKESTPQSTECEEILKVVKGEAEWDREAGKIVFKKDIISAIELDAESRHKVSVPPQSVPDATVPPADLESKDASAEQITRDTSFKAYGPFGKYWFMWGHAPHELGEPPEYSLGKLDQSSDPDAELQTIHLETYLLQSGDLFSVLNRSTRIEDPFIFNFGEYEALSPQQKATVQGFCKERIRILTKVWPNVDQRYWKHGGWYESTVFSQSGNFYRNQLKPVCE